MLPLITIIAGLVDAGAGAATRGRLNELKSRLGIESSRGFWPNHPDDLVGVLHLVLDRSTGPFLAETDYDKEMTRRIRGEPELFYPLIWMLLGRTAFLRERDIERRRLESEHRSIS